MLSSLLICNHQVIRSIRIAGTSNIKGLQRCKPFSFAQVSTNCQPRQRVELSNTALLVEMTLNLPMVAGTLLMVGSCLIALKLNHCERA